MIWERLRYFVFVFAPVLVAAGTGIGAGLVYDATGESGLFAALTIISALTGMGSVLWLLQRGDDGLTWTAHLDQRIETLRRERDFRALTAKARPAAQGDLSLVKPETTRDAS